MEGTGYVGGTYAPAVARRREGPDDAPGVLVVVEPGSGAAPERPTVAPHHLDREVFLVRPRPRPQVTVNGRPYELPYDDRPALEDFLFMAYLVYGWGPIVDVGRELERMRDAKLHPGRDLSRDLALRDVTVADTARWLMAYRETAADLRERILSKARALERTALDIVLAMLRRSAERVVDQMVAYFQWSRREDAIDALEVLRSPPLQENQEPVQDLRERLARLRAPAKQVKESRHRAWTERRRQRQLLGRDQVGINNPATVEELRRLEAAARQADQVFAEALLREAAGSPVLYRFDLESVLAADANAGEMIFKRLRRTWRANQDLYEALRTSRPAQAVDDQAVRRSVLPERALAAHIEGSVWAHEKVLAAALDRLPVADGDLYDRLLDNLAAARENEEITESRLGMLKSLGLSAVTIALLAVCPPAGIALDVGLSVADLVETAAEYERAEDETLCDLDPRECLSAVTPSGVVLVMAITSALLSAAPL